MTDKQNVSRQVIENKLLAALDDDDKVAIIASQRDCDLLVYALNRAHAACPSRNTREEIAEFISDLRELYKSAFVTGERDSDA